MEYFICCDIIPKIKDNLEIKDKEIFYLLWYYICYDIIMKIKDNEIFYLLWYYICYDIWSDRSSVVDDVSIREPRGPLAGWHVDQVAER